MVNIYRMPDEEQQTGRADELPYGTRGGLAIRGSVAKSAAVILLR
jgi:hypothetical protein